MRQYMEQKEKYPDCILLFRVGDFYEMFYEDAVVASEALGLVLTSRDKNRENPIPLCGVPYHALKTYLPRLLDSGFKVAVCEQIENPKDAKGVVRRDVTRVVTPGLIMDEEQLDSRTTNYITALYSDETPDFGIASADISTGEFRIAKVTGEDALLSEISRIRPRQLITDSETADFLKTCFRGNDILIEDRIHRFQDFHEAEEFLHRYSQDVFPTETSTPQVIIAGAALLKEMGRAHPADELPKMRIIPYIPGNFMVLDETTITNLELFFNSREKKRYGSLIGIIDQTSTGMGGRKLRSWVNYPLLDIGEIRNRQDAVEILFERSDLRRNLMDRLRTLPDIERISTRISHLVATPRDLGTLRNGLYMIPDMHSILDEIGKSLTVGLPSLLDMGDDKLEDILTLLENLVDEPPVYLKDGGVFKSGFNPGLDELIEFTSGGRDALIAIEERERKRTGIGSLKVKFNKVFGYYIEIPRSRTSEIPEEYMRKQTLANAERFVTPELADLEGKVLSAQEKRVLLEEKLFVELRESIALMCFRIAGLADMIGTIDALVSLAQVAHKNGYTRPFVDTSDEITIHDGRHPVIEMMTGLSDFIPNDIKLSGKDRQILLITGPNMAGKSTVIRQLALSVLLAQIGSFIPARKASIGICDRIFSRVGASDNIARGESTFMVEMKETASILTYATSRSLIILDEIGRGTSTWDGVSIAWSVAEYIHDHIGARTLFATHYHELAALIDVKPRIALGAVTVREWNGTILFLRKLVNGSVNRSYGIQVAELAGVPSNVTNRAKQIMKALEEGESLVVPGNRYERHIQPGLFSSMEKTPEKVQEVLIDHPIVERFSHIDPDNLSPKKALELMYELKLLM